MTIKLGSYVLCAGDTRNSAGDPVGPQNLRLQETPGVAVREFVGADRVKPEHVRSDSGSVTFGVTRTFASAADALAYIRTRLVGGQQTSEPSEGQLKFDDVAVFGPKSVVTQRVAALVGCTVAVNYSITG